MNAFARKVHQEKLAREAHALSLKLQRSIYSLPVDRTLGLPETVERNTYKVELSRRIARIWFRAQDRYYRRYRTLKGR